MLISDAFAAAGEAGAQGGSMAVTLTQLGLITFSSFVRKLKKSKSMRQWRKGLKLVTKY